MPCRFITKSIHTYLIDYPVAIVWMVAPFLLKLGKSSPVALWLSVVTRVTPLMLPALTDHPTGLVRGIHYWLHLWVDRALGVVSIIAPSAFHFTGLDAWHYWVLAAAVWLTTSVLNAPEASAAHARLEQPEIRIAFIPLIATTRALARLIGRSRAMHYLYQGDLIVASEAQRWGLIDEVREPSTLRKRVQAYAEELVGNARRRASFTDFAPVVVIAEGIEDDFAGCPMIRERLL
ncbi:enoyl-CoA hydratase/isomerase family protein [Bradyrhizobium sp. Ash2021]|uniref:enoyl-CoA hydratase/isomerase family protein n=1 Tax=Bradyrhizobium sp. Ash2021 TaxID=2954771 RepID=UPI0028157363|nr:enoyl-CoA hydratase/isomerase family protein [Bradyrhizobium sp. Ash2021]WMT76860.1 enoyl-CoA hydratase/isomerase family protein [Bradyrhizobium sp. Ash2021]